MRGSGRNSNSSKILCMPSLPASIKRIGLKTTEKRWRHHFPHCKSMGAFCCHGNQCFDPICPKTLCSLSPTPVMLHIKFDQDWTTGFRDIKVFSVAMEISFDPICPKTLCNLFPTPRRLQIKFDPDWPTGFRDIQIQIFKFKYSNSKL